MASEFIYLVPFYYFISKYYLFSSRLRKLDHNKIKEMNIQFMPGYEDPYHHRPMTMGEIGCFLSHFYIWQNIVEKKLDEVLILEDDIRFEPYFKENAEKIIKQARSLKEYDLM